MFLDETSDIQCKSQLFTVLHYIHERKICERFLGFTDVSTDRNSDHLFSPVQLNPVFSLTNGVRITDK